MGAISRDFSDDYAKVGYRPVFKSTSLYKNHISETTKRRKEKSVPFREVKRYAFVATKNSFGIHFHNEIFVTINDMQSAT